MAWGAHAGGMLRSRRHHKALASTVSRGPVERKLCVRPVANVSP